MNVEKFTEYFLKLEGFKVPCIDIPMRAHEVEVYYLEDICKKMGVPEPQRTFLLSEPKKPSMLQDRRELLVSFIFKLHEDKELKHAFLVFLSGISIIAEVVRYFVII